MYEASAGGGDLAKQLSSLICSKYFVSNEV